MIMTTQTAHIILSENWELFRSHRPVGAYLPTGQLDGDCRVCGGSWPCEPIKNVFDGSMSFSNPRAEHQIAHIARNEIVCSCGDLRTNYGLTRTLISCWSEHLKEVTKENADV